MSILALKHTKSRVLGTGLGAAFLLAAAAPAMGATIAVNSIADEVNAGNGQCTLREAVLNANANNNTASGTDCAAGDMGADTITIGNVVYPLATELAVTDILTVTGPSTLDGQGNSRIFNNTSTLTLNNLVLRNGLANGAGNPANSGGAILNGAGGVLVVNGGAMNNNTSVRAGGAIEEASGAAAGTTAVTLNNVNFANNDAGPMPGNGGALHVSGSGDIVVNGGTYNNNTAQEGGALWNGDGTMTVAGTTANPVVISNNTATCAATVNGPTGGPGAGGGGIFNIAGTLTVTGNTTITTNQATGPVCSGGGINTFTGSTLTVGSGVEISSNTANRAGGGIEAAPGSTTQITSATLSGNTANTTDNAAAAGGNGGALHITGDGNATITSGTVTNNVADSEGGGLWNGAGNMTVVGATIDGNIANGGTADAADQNAQGGGGIFNDAGTVAVSGATTINNNQAAGSVSSGGGIFTNNGTTLNVTEGTVISNNTANRAGGGIEARAGSNTNFANSALSGNTANTTAGGGGGNGGGMHITGNGNLFISASLVRGNNADTEGGGLWNNSGTMLVVGTNLISNSGNGAVAANGGGAIFNNGGGGTGVVTVTNSRMIGNSANGASGSGGAILNLTGSTSVTDSVIAANSANRAGGGIEVAAGSSVSLNRVTLGGTSAGAGNDAGTSPGNGGGLHISGNGTVTIDDSAVGFNQGEEGGGLWNSPAGTLTVNNSTVSNNTARSSDGGGIYLETGDSVTSTNTFSFITVARNNSDTVGGINAAGSAQATVGSSLIVENAGANTAGTINGTTNITSGTGLINDFQIIGGNTATHALPTGSAAIDQADAAACALAPINSQDQRTFARAAACDAGAFELTAVDANIVGASNNRSSNTLAAGDDTQVLAFNLANTTGTDETINSVSGRINVNSANGSALTFTGFQVTQSDASAGTAPVAVPATAAVNADGTFTVTFTGGFILANGDSTNFAVTADVGGPTMTASVVMMTPVFAGGALLGLLGLFSLGGMRRRSQYLLLGAMLVVGLSACGGGGSGGGGNNDGANADASSETLGDAQFSMQSVNGDNSFVVTGLPINGAGIIAP